MEIKTYKKWRELKVKFEEYVKPDDIVDEEMAAYFHEVDWTTGDKDLIQGNEPYGYAFDVDLEYDGILYHTFKKEGEYWIYCGTCFENETEHREYDKYAEDKKWLLNDDLEDLKDDIEREKKGNSSEKYVKFLTDYYFWRVTQRFQENYFNGKYDELIKKNNELYRGNRKILGEAKKKKPREEE